MALDRQIMAMDPKQSTSSGATKLPGRNNPNTTRITDNWSPVAHECCQKNSKSTHRFSGEARVMAHSASIAAAATLGLPWVALGCPGGARCFSSKVTKEARPPPRRNAACNTGKGTPCPVRCGFVNPFSAARARSCRSSSSACPRRSKQGGDPISFLLPDMPGTLHRVIVVVVTHHRKQYCHSRQPPTQKRGIVTNIISDIHSYLYGISVRTCCD